ncbi:predicted protein [Naegleria gruberi]|uniref:Predicted protein n=1 Tax=Naegleria gruberi TaxID=5762 RepID=D2VRI5_NAEGR|nr:uncharacterized protein NAEGRDRAFT_82733 [Naegleria gruberi]EFC40681.1 predicted protein [Naegleria gruberi]|eukprot:XP_002673425.1 predicted protein [Naegleria gruberi strain NEG-M]
MTKGTQSFGLRHTKTHGMCPRCDRRSYHIQKKTCASCGFPSPKIRKYQWAYKAIRRNTTGTGRCRYLKLALRRERNGWKVGSTPKAAVNNKQN